LELRNQSNLDVVCFNFFHTINSAQIVFLIKDEPREVNTILIEQKIIQTEEEIQKQLNEELKPEWVI
jgi:hypothetical protein